jgi:O-antigen/teichoic acid export membrane protein
MENKENIDQIKGRAVRGTLTLTARRIILKGIDLLGMIFLARLLTQEEFGIFGIINFIVFTLFGFLSDIGLGASLIQKKEKIKKDDLATVFTTQLFLVLILNCLVWLLSPYLVRVYNLSPAHVWLLRTTAFCLILTSFKTIPSVLLERELLYEKLLIPEIAETISYNILAVFLAFRGFGVWSLTISLLVRTFLGAVILFFISPWPIRLKIKRASLKSLLSFGVPYQLNSLLSLLKDNLTPTVIAFFYGPAAVGYVNLAQSIATKPMEITNIVNRLVFPTFSKIQEDRERVGRWLEKGVRLMAYLYFPLVLGLLVTARPILTYVYADRSDKWLPALSALYPFIIGSLPVVFTTTATNVIYALGKAKTVLRLMVIYTLVTWAVGIPLILEIGFSGIAWAGVVVGALSVLLVNRELRKEKVNFSLAQAVAIPFAASLLMALCLWPVVSGVNGIPGLIGVVVLGAFLYLLFLFLFLRGKIKEEVALVKSLLPKHEKN